MTIRAHDVMPMFAARSSTDNALVRYDDLWQRKNLLLVSLPEDDPTAAAYASSFSLLRSDLSVYDAVLLVTTMQIEGIPSPGVVVADRWGEVYYVQAADQASGLPSPHDLVDWLRFVRNECPECQGETR